MQNHGSSFLVKAHHTRRAVHILVLTKSRMRCAVRIDHTVTAEVTVVHLFPMISAVEIHRLSVFCGSFVDCVVTPLPDKATAHSIVLFHLLEVIL